MCSCGLAVGSTYRAAQAEGVKIVWPEAIAMGRARQREADSDAFVLSIPVNPSHTALNHFSLGQQRGGLPD